MLTLQKNNISKKGKEFNNPLFLQFQKGHDKGTREKLIIAHAYLVHKLAKRYAKKGKPMESLISVGTIGLINAIDNYDINKGTKFVTYCTVHILGEIKKCFRDTGWLLKVPRKLKDLNTTIQATIGRLTQELGRSPTIEDIAINLNISQEKVLEAIEVRRAYKPTSLDTTFDMDDERTLHDYLSIEDKNISLKKYDLYETLQKLPKREQVIVHLFYYKKFSQLIIAERLGITQSHVSRLLHQALDNLKKMLKEKE